MLHPTVLAYVRRSHRPRRSRSLLLPELLHPVPAMVHLRCQALNSRDADGQVQPAIAWAVHTVLVLLHISQRIGRDLPRIVAGAIQQRRPQAGGARPQSPQDLADMPRPDPAQPARVQGRFTIREDECMS
jgi:hypothetical protein